MMLPTSRQLKALVRNLSQGNSAKAQMIIRTYAMERFLERLSLSQYREYLILKGGALIASMVGLNNRSTMDMDATLKNLPLTQESAQKIVAEIISIQIDDGMVFEIKGVAPIMAEEEYPGIRLSLEAMLETMRTPLKIDFSTGDVITPQAVAYSYPLLFEDRSLSILAYNLETVLAEKLETLLARGTANTRLRDFYDIDVLVRLYEGRLDEAVLKEAFANTSQQRGSQNLLPDADLILSEISESEELASLWKGYQRKFDYAKPIQWPDVMASVNRLATIVK